MVRGMVMRLVILESPYAGDVARNLAYARACMADCLARGEAPYASHLLYAQPGVLDDSKPDERALGMAAGFAWGERADATVVYTDLGTSAGMVAGIERAKAAGRAVEMRMLPGWVAPEPVDDRTPYCSHGYVRCGGCHGRLALYEWCDECRRPEDG